MGVAVPSTFVSIGDLNSVKNALQTMYNYQVSLKSVVMMIAQRLIATQESHHWSISGSWATSTTTRFRYVSYVDHDWNVQLPALQ
jgi:hypothetical protein